MKRMAQPAAAFVALLAIWQLADLLGFTSRGLFPSPLDTLRGLGELLLDGRLVDYSIASLFRVTLGWFLAVILAVPLGLMIGWSAPLQNAMNPLLQFLRPISPLAWIPVALLWFGIGDPPAVFLIFLSSFFPLVVSVMSAVSGINKLYVRAAQNIGIKGLRMMVKVVFPATLPSIIVSLRISLGIAWLVVVAAEMIAVKSGLGYLIIDARNALRMDWVIAGMIAIGLLGIVLDRGIRRLEGLESVRWGIVHN